MSVREIVKNNPWKSLIGSVSLGTIIFTVAGTLFSDARYAHASDVERFKAETTLVIKDLQKQISELKK